jgi:hypothetical protein
VRRERLPGYRLVIEHDRGVDRLSFMPIAVDPLAASLRRRPTAGERL